MGDVIQLDTNRLDLAFEELTEAIGEVCEKYGLTDVELIYLNAQYTYNIENILWGYDEYEDE